jgi:hypothetical protein
VRRSSIGRGFFGLCFAGALLSCGGGSSSPEGDSNDEGLTAGTDAATSSPSDTGDADPDTSGTAGGDSTGGDDDPNAPSGPTCDELEVQFSRLAPNVYVTVDESGSMTNTDDTDPPISRIDRAKEGLVAMAEAIDGNIRLGIAGFAGNCDGSDVIEYLPMGDHMLPEMLEAIDVLSARGGTPMHAAVKDIREQNRLADATDPHDANRTKVAVLIGDGRPNRCSCDYPNSECHDAVISELELLHDDLDVPTFIVGFAFTADIFEDFAVAGNTAHIGPDPYYIADDGESLAQALTEISSLYIECRFVIDPPPPDPDKIWVSVNGVWLSPDQFHYEDGELTLDDEVCQSLEDLAVDLDVAVEIVVGCPPPG